MQSNTNEHFVLIFLILLLSDILSFQMLGIDTLIVTNYRNGPEEPAIVFDSKNHLQIFFKCRLPCLLLHLLI